MEKLVGYAGLAQLSKGQKVLYRAGRGRHRIEANAILTSEPGTTGAMIRITKITLKGDDAEGAVGERRLAGAKELFLETAS